MRHCGFYKHAEVFLLKANNKERRIKEALARVGGRDHQRLSSLANPHRGCEPTTVEAREAFFSL